jgi:hypothetical protein
LVSSITGLRESPYDLRLSGITTDLASYQELFGNQNRSLHCEGVERLAYNVYNRMPRVKSNGVLERSAMADLWKNTLSQIPTVYGRLSYLASLRDPNSGIYRHHGLAAMFGREESSRALRQSHQQAFAEWLKLSIKQKKLDLTEYFAGLDDSVRVIVDHLLTSQIYRAQIPAYARRMERELYCTDLEVLLETIRGGLSEGASDPGSSRRA